MNCSAMRRWLDEGMVSRLEPSALAHAARCPECSALLQAQREIDAALSLDLEAEAPSDRSLFVDRVMRQVASAECPRQVELWPAMRPLPWWVEAAADPAAVLACALAALLLWKKVDWFAPFARLLSERWSLLALPAIAQARDALGFDRPAVALGLGLSIMLLIGWVSFYLYRWSERLTRRSAGA